MGDKYTETSPFARRRPTHENSPKKKASLMSDSPRGTSYGEHPLPKWPGPERRPPGGGGVGRAASYGPGLEATVKDYTG
jgi:hypothetical protein